MGQGNGNGAHYVFENFDVTVPLDDTQIDKIATKVAKKLDNAYSRAASPKTTFNSKAVATIIGIVLTVGGLVWSASALMSSKSNVADVKIMYDSVTEKVIDLEKRADRHDMAHDQIKESLGEIKITLDKLLNR